MKNILNLEKSVFEQLKDNDTTIKDVCKMANISYRTVYNWKQKDPQSIEQLKRINDVINLTEKLKKINVKLKLVDNYIHIIDVKKNFTTDPISEQVKKIAKEEIKKDHSDEKLELLIKIIKSCKL